MDDELSRLETLKVIAETLNQGNDLNRMLQLVLERLLEVTGIQTGWIFLIDAGGVTHLAADVRLPPALARDGKQPMCGGNCWCVDRYRSGRLTNAVNIMECKRIDDAIVRHAGDTQGITHHMTVPLQAGEETFGLLNVASSHKTHFRSEELALLQSIAFQIGAAIKRMGLFQKEQKRASLYQSLNRFVADIRAHHGLDELLHEVGETLMNSFPWQSIALVCNGYAVNNRVASGVGGKTRNARAQVGETEVHLSIGQDPWDEVDQEVADQLANHIGLALENERLNEERKDITVLQERNRFARDLHDSVNQLLFSLNLTLRGTQELTADPKVLEALTDAQSLSREALKEMKALIWQLRPAGLEEGVAKALALFAEKNGLRLEIGLEGVFDLPQLMEECLWRVGQEALQNVKKHANTTEAILRITRTSGAVTMEIEDRGKGFTYDEGIPSATIGLKSMRERVELHNGELEITSLEHRGTRIRVTLPVKERDRHGD